eukprot:scaffold18219_cov33-Tisochrysis_lutea.AAC.3
MIRLAAICLPKWYNVCIPFSRRHRRPKCTTALPGVAKTYLTARQKPACIASHSACVAPYSSTRLYVLCVSH